MLKRTILIDEGIDKIIRCFKFVHFPVNWKISLNDNKVEWWDEYSKNLRKKDEVRKKQVASLNNKIKLALQENEYEKALQYIEQAKNVRKEETLFSREKYEEIQAIKKKTQNASAAKDYKEYFELLKILHQLNPFSLKIKRELDDLEEYHLLTEEIAKEKDPYKLSLKINNARDFIRQLPSYLNADFEKRIAAPLRTVETEIVTLIQLSAEEEEREELDHAIELLREAINIEFDTDRKTRVSSKISQLERSQSQGKLLKYLTVIVFVLVIIILYLLV